ncbi:hypothetical protein DCAR_0520446 [Daucus carota subsp. sativus]|uniref:Protein kinase domain-containing protein n=1 Tax=Daucus carota subsp. sativus TaxID=79200 RepID=A0AAF0X5Y1_DAUCS|nr:hypothetical protein DCAR_0520446 [Daucus carota subsp. sativus]
MKDSSALTRRKKPKIKLVCSFDGAFTLRRPPAYLRYTGGETRIISVDRAITFSRLSAKISELMKCPKQAFYLNYQVSDGENEEKHSPLALIASDDDVRCMIDVFEKLETRGRYYRLWIYVCDYDEYVNLQKLMKLRNVVCNKVDAFDDVKYSNDCLRKIVLRQQLVVKQSDFIGRRFHELGLGGEEGEVERSRINDENFVNPRFVRSSKDYEEYEFSKDYSKESRSYEDNCHRLNVKDSEDQECNGDSTVGRRSDVDLVDSFGSRSFADSVSLAVLHSQPMDRKDMVGYKYDDDNFMENRSFVNSVQLAVSHSRPMDRKNMVGYKYDDDNFTESRSYVDSIPLSASHSQPLISKDRNSGVGINESDSVLVNAGRIVSFNSSDSIGTLHCPRPYAMMSYHDGNCESRSAEPATLSNLNRENLVPCSADSMTLRPGLAPLFCNNQLLGGLSTTTFSCISSDSGFNNKHFCQGNATKQGIYQSHSRSDPGNFTEIVNHRKGRFNGRPWMGRFYPIQSSSGISKQGKVVKTSHLTLSKSLSDSSSQQVECNARASLCILNNLTSSFAFPSASEGNIGEHVSGVSQDGNTNPEFLFCFHDPLSGIADQSFSSLVNAEEFPQCTEGLDTQIDFLSDCVPKQHSAAKHQDASNISRSPKKADAIKNSDLEYIRELGSGTYGTVYYGKWKGSDVAIKKLKPGCFDGGAVEENRLIADFWKEAHILGQLRHPNIVALYGVVADGPATNLATVTEFMINGSLKQVFRRKDRTIDRRKRLILAMDTAFGMEYLHEKNIVHFDLKSHNLLVNMRDPRRPVCKIGDLGLSKIKQKTLVSGGVRGTVPWMAPELLSCKSLVTEKVDVYSFGIVMWELLTGEEPYSKMRSHEIIAGIIKGTLRPETPAWCDPAWRSLMEKCWSTDPANRPAFSEIAKELRTMATAMNIK